MQESRNSEAWKHSIIVLVCAPLQFWLFRKHVLQSILQAQPRSLLADTHILRALCSQASSLVFQTVKTMWASILQGQHLASIRLDLINTDVLAFSMDPREHIQFPLPRHPANKWNVFSVRKGFSMPPFGTYSSNLACCTGHECSPDQAVSGTQKARLQISIHSPCKS